MLIRRFALALLAAIILSPAASAQSFPARSMTIVVPFGVGSALDLIARIIGSRLAEVLGQPVLVENVSGGGGMTAAARVANAPPDGYQMLHGGVDVMSMNQTLYKKPLYNALTDFVPVGLVGDQALVLIARKDFPADDMREFIAYTKRTTTRCSSVRAALAPAPISIACVSTPPSASKSRTFPIAVRRRRCRTCSPAGSTITARSRRPRSARSKASRPRALRS
jgi:tripartite-type tricarboxylate transporter receptor subunit TctC